jgi:hypothetical protein
MGDDHARGLAVRLSTTSTAGASVNEAPSATSTPIAAGIPRLWK